MGDVLFRPDDVARLVEAAERQVEELREIRRSAGAALQSPLQGGELSSESTSSQGRGSRLPARIVEPDPRSRGSPWWATLRTGSQE